MKRTPLYEEHKLPRNQIIWDGAIFHVTWQCHNYDWLLKADWAKQLYYDLLLKYKDRYQVVFSFDDRPLVCVYQRLLLKNA